MYKVHPEYLYAVSAIEVSPDVTEALKRTPSISRSQSSAYTPPHKMTPKRFLEYEKRREEAAIGEWCYFA